MSFAKGCRLDRGRHQRTPFAVAKMRGLASAPIPAAADLTAFAPPVMDQTSFSGCEGASSSGAIYTTLAKAGEPLPWVPSQSGIYGLARALDRADPSIALTDEGTETNAVERAISEFGVRPMARNVDGTNCDFDAATINAEPLLFDLEQDALTVLIGAYQITSLGSSRLDDVKIAIASGFAVRVDTEVDRAFEDWTPSRAPYGVPDFANSLGGHALYCVGFHGDVFVIRNSWGSAWGSAGHILVNAAFIEQADCFAWAVKRAQ